MNNKINWNKIIYDSGDVFLPKSIKNVLEKTIYFDNTSTFYLSGWTIMHFLSGIIVGYIYLYLNKPLEHYYFKLFIIHTMWEFWQMLIGMSKPYKLTGTSNLIDTIVDTIAFMLGGYVMLYYYKK